METKQYNLKLPKAFAAQVESYAEEKGYRNVQELVSESLREKLDKTKMDLITKLLEKTIEKNDFASEEEVWKVLRE